MMKNKSMLLAAAVTLTILGNTNAAMTATYKMPEFNHSSHGNHGSMVHDMSMDVKLTEAGTDPFATIQEVIAVLNANPNTDWERVDIESLRVHLTEMEDMTLNVSVIQHDIDDGFTATITPTTDRAWHSLNKVFSAHPAQMSAETGWVMSVNDVDNEGISIDGFSIAVTTDVKSEVAKIRGLGYIGVMAYGNHHQTHHWSMASGGNPHANH
jgi:hypothetical protein